MNRVYLGLGSNLGNRKLNLGLCLNEISNQMGSLVRCSKIYETESWGYSDPNLYLNQVVLLETRLNALECLACIENIEKSMGRTRNKDGYEARTIDVDILFFNSEIINVSQLQVPHPEIQNRKFVLVPITELDSGLIHPGLNLTVTELLNQCSDSSNVTEFNS